MKTKHLYTISLVGMLAVGCGSSYPLLNETAISETAELKSYCAAQGISSDYTKTADSLYTLSGEFHDSGKKEEAYRSAQQAQTLYHLAITSNQLSDSQMEVKQMEKALWNAKEQLRTYKEVLRELEGMRLQ